MWLSYENEEGKLITIKQPSINHLSEYEDVHIKLIRLLFPHIMPFPHLYNVVGHGQHIVVSSAKSYFHNFFLFLFQKGYYKQLGKLLQNFTDLKTTANGDSMKVENGEDHNNGDSVENGSNGSSNNGHHDNKQEPNGSNGCIREQCDNDHHDNTKETNGSSPSIDDEIKENENQEEVIEIADDNNENKGETTEITEDNENTTKKNDDQKVGWYRIFPMRLGLV